MSDEIIVKINGYDYWCTSVFSEDGIYTLYDFDGNIYAQYDLYEIKDATDKKLFENTDLGRFGLYEDQKVPLDLPLMEMVNEEELEEEKKQPALGKPHRGGSKKFYVYVKDPKTKRIKKVSFGMAGGGLRAKLNNPKARQAFSKRHNCPQKKDRTKASYWSCRLPRYAKLLGFKTTFSGYW